MLNGTFKKIFIALIIFCSGAILYAQNGAYVNFTPYSIYGIGDISKQGTAYNKSMGGVGVATRNNRYINYLNPAACTARDTLSFMSDFGLSSTNKMFKQDDLNSFKNTINLSNFIISFPIYRSSAMYFGIAPFSNIGYTVAAPVEDPSVIGNTGNITYSASGSGSLYDLFIGGGVTLWKRLSLGAQASYYFGNLEKATVLAFSNSSYRSMYSGSNLNLHSLTGKFGMQYEAPVGKNNSLIIGGTYRLKSNLKGYNENYSFATISSVTDTLSYSSDTLKYAANKIQVASELGVGISFKVKDKLSVEVDYLRSDWSSSNFDATQGFSNVSQYATFKSTCSQSIRGGFEFTPNRNDIRYYYKRITYRGGLYYDKEYYLLNDSPVNTIGLTFGATLPINRLYNGLTLAVEVGQRGYAADHLVRERFINFHLGINIFDRWFQKIRYE